jgi:aromatic ring-opening dioxygenase LigB subunit
MKESRQGMATDLAVKQVGQKIYFIRGHGVMLDSDLADLYQVELRALNQAVRRNLVRFPEDFMFQLSEAEYESLRSQIVIIKSSRGQHRKYLPLVFTEQGVAMLSGVLHSKCAVHVNIAIMRAFVKLRKMLGANKELAKKFKGLERKFVLHDAQFAVVFDAIRQIMLAGAPGTQRKVKGLSKE